MSARLVFEFAGKTTELAQTIGGVKAMFADLAKSASQPANAGRSSGIGAAIDQQRKQLGLMKGDYDGITAAAIEFRRKGAPQELITQYVALRREIAANEAASAAAATRKKADQDAELERTRQLARIEGLRQQSASRRQAASLTQAEQGSARSQSVRGSLQGEIAAQQAELQKLKGTYDGVLASALKYKQQGAPTDLIVQYIRLRREIQQTKALKDSAAAKLKADKDAELLLIQRNAAYEASQARLSAMRQAGIAQNRSVASGARSAMMMRGMAGGGGGMMFPMAMNSLAVGFQDAVSVYQVNKSALAAISAAGNNIIFLLTLMNPLYGAIGAIAIGLTQLGVAWLSSGDNAEESAKKQEAAAKRIEDGLKRQLELRESFQKGDASEIDGEVNSLRSDISSREKRIEALKTMWGDVDRTPENQLGGAEGKQQRKDAIDKLIQENHGELREKRSALGVAEELQKKITPLMRNADRRNDSGQAKTITELSEELKVLNGKMTEREAFIAKEVRGGGSRIAAGEEFDLREQIKAKQKEKTDAEAAAKEAERANETAARKKDADQQKRETEATSLREQLMNPNERYQSDVGKFRAQYDAGDIDQETFQRAERAARKTRDDDLLQKIPERVTHAPSLLKGTVEAARVASTGRRDEKMQQLAEQQLAETRKLTRVTEKNFRNPMQRPRVAKES